jgi:hypothetical protein
MLLPTGGASTCMQGSRLELHIGGATQTAGPKPSAEINHPWMLWQFKF